MNNGHDQILSQADSKHRIYLCEYGLVHVEWGKHRLVYCPGDLMGLPYLLSALLTPCNLECQRDEQCPLENEDNRISLPYGSVQISLTSEECQTLHLAAQEAAQRLQRLRSQGYFSNQKWLPQRAIKNDTNLIQRSPIFFKTLKKRKEYQNDRKSNPHN